MGLVLGKFSWFSLLKRVFGIKQNGETATREALSDREKAILERELIESGLQRPAQSASILSNANDMFGLRTGTKISLDDELRTSNGDLPNVGRLSVSPSEAAQIHRDRQG